MPVLNLKPSHKPVKDYYKALRQTTNQMSLLHEGAVAPHFANLLRACASRVGWTLQEQFQIPRKGQRPLRADGVLLDSYKLRHGVWEAKDSDDDLAAEVKKKFAQGYPQDNILFQAPDRAILVQDGRILIDTDLTDPAKLVDVLQEFFAYQPPAFEQWDRAVAEFKDRVPELAQSLLDLIEQERKQNKTFRDALTNFKELMREAINPNISDQAVEEMLIQHLLTERIFRKVFNNPDFAQRNIIAREIEKVIDALTSRHFSRHDFLRNLDRFYGAIETTAATIDEFSEKQDFLNTVYENFFQGFSVKVADTHGIVYTPQPIVDFMVRSVDDILKREFGKADGLASDGVAILDPFVGTGNFILRVMRQMPKSQLPDKYAGELFCNEVMLLPYYIASMNIEHEYYELTGRYQPFEGISLVDTFELAEGRQMPLFAPENTQRVQRQKNTPIFVIIGNPPYNAKQLDENDNSKNRKYQIMDQRVYETYAVDSKATLVNQLSDPYVKAIRWATDRIETEGIVALVTNNSFIDSISFDGVRKHLARDFSKLYVLDLGGNAWRSQQVSDSNVFGIRVGVSINLFIKQAAESEKSAQIFYAQAEDSWHKGEKFEYLDERKSHTNIEWQELEPNRDYLWLTSGLQRNYETFLQIGDKENKRARDVQAIFRTFSNGVKTNNDAYVFNFDDEALDTIANAMVEDFNAHRDKWIRVGQPKDISKILTVNEKVLKWIRRTKKSLIRGLEAEYKESAIRKAIYRPFSKRYYFCDPLFTEDMYFFPKIFPTIQSEEENTVVCVSGIGHDIFRCQISKLITEHKFSNSENGGSQCFPFYTYDAITPSPAHPSPPASYTRRENITDWALAQFRDVYAAAPTQTCEVSETSQVSDDITKWDIFHYIYALLHHPDYRETYAANLRRELPRIPFVQPEHFWPFVESGKRLANIHVHYEDQPQYPLQHEEAPDLPLDYRVEKMRLSKDKTSLKYNDFLTLHGIPPQVFDYKLGNRSALDWVIDQYRVKTDKRSGITNDPNNLEDETYILRLIKQVITVSLETVEIVNNLPPLEIIEP